MIVILLLILIGAVLGGWWGALLSVPVLWLVLLVLGAIWDAA